MRKASFILLLLFLSFTYGAVHKATLDGVVDYDMKKIVELALEGAEDNDTIIFVVNTDGGLVSAAIDISDLIFSSPQHTIAFIEQRAISAGALISVACNSIVMKKGSTIGDCAPIMIGSDGPRMLGEKTQSPIRAKFRVYAKEAGYPSSLAEAMVSIDMVIYKLVDGDSTTYLKEEEYLSLDSITKERATLFVKKGELLTLSNYEAADVGFSKASHNNLNDYMEKERMVISGKEIKRSPFVSLVSSLFPLLLIIGMAAVFIESKVPGVGVPGVVGVLCLALAFAGKYMVGLAGGTELLLLLIGFILLAAEVFVFPGFGISGILGILCIAIAGVLAMQDFVIPSRENPLEIELFVDNLKIIGFSFLGSVALIIGFFTLIFPRMNAIAPGTILHEDLNSTVDEAVVKKRDERRALIGRIAEVIMELRPSGSIKIDGKMYDATSQSFYIEKGSTVKVVDLKGPYFIVEVAEEKATEV